MDATPSQTAALLSRLYLGLVFSVAAISKITAPSGFSHVLAGYLNGVALVTGFAWYQQVVRGLILPHSALFAAIVVAAEAFVAVSMLLGVVTRFGAAVAVLLLLNYMFSKGMPPWAPASNDAADIVLALTVALTNAGTVFGIDGILQRRLTFGRRAGESH